MKLIVGLGNPGKEYENTYHNIGFNILDGFSFIKNLKYKEKYNGLYIDTVINNQKVILLKPLSYINLSGEVLIKYVNYFKINIEDILIIHDDMDLEIGKYKLRASGGSAGHNGLKNIEFHLKTKDYKRLKIGIGKSIEMDKKSYVLSKIKNKEIYDEFQNVANNIINDFTVLSFEKLMTKYN